MLTGLWPKRHGVLSWHHHIPEVEHLLSLPGYDCGYYMPGEEDVLNDGTFTILGKDERREITDLNSPWTYLERHHGGHAPFHAAGWSGTWQEFEATFAGDSRKHRRWYRRAIDGSVEDFERRLDTLERKGELTDTLVVFTSDHGEYLGEDGLVDHTSPVRPEGVYVPTVFIHPDIDGGRQATGIMRHVDLFPTLLGVLDKEIPSFVDGMNLALETPDQGYSLSTANIYALGEPRRIFEAASVWDGDGGHVINRTSLLRRLLTTIGLLTGRDWKSKHLRRSPSQIPVAMRHYLQNRQTFGDPKFDFETACDMITDVEAANPISPKETEQLDEKTKERLQKLGYL